MAHRIGRSQKVTNGHTLGVSCWAIIRIKSDQTMMVVEVEALIREPVKNYLADFFPLRGGVYP